MKKRKIIILVSILLVLTLSGAFAAWLISNQRVKASGNKLGVAWYDEAGTEFVISTSDELYELMKLSEYYDFKDQTIKLGADIVVNEGSANEWDKKAPSRKWYPITGFAGTFDGQGHTISGLYGYGVKCEMGLFSNTDKSCLIKNFKIINSYFKVSGNDPVGSVASNGCGSFETIYSDAIISSDGQNSGGLIGIANKGKQANSAGQTTKISNCWYDGEIRLTTKAGYLSGGIVGAIYGGTCNIYHCLNSGNISSVADITAGVYIGGIAGRLLYENYGGTAYIKDCLNVGHIQSELQTGVGEIIGGVAAKASVSLSKTYMLMGNLEVCNKISGTFNGGATAIDTEMISGPQWYSWTALDFSQYWAVTEDSTPVLKSFADEIPDVSGLAKMYSFDWFDENQSENYINTAEDLYGFALLSQENNFENCFISLGNDIVINEGNAADWAEKAPEKMWFPIAGGLTNGQMFKGVFDGQGYTISGLYLKTNIPGSGLFTGASSESAIQNLKLTNSYFEYTGEIGSTAVLGSVAGRANGTVSNIYSDAIVRSTGIVNGGILGQISATGKHFVSNCWFDGKIELLGEGTTGARQAGGIVGRIQKGDTTMEHCLNTGTISCEASQTALCIGGLCGYFMNGSENMVLNISDCLNAGSVDLIYNVGVGTIVGRVREETTINIQDTYVVEDCYTITMEDTVKKPATVGYNKGNVNGLAVYKPKEMISGYEAYRWTSLDFSQYWAVVLTDTPILKTFAMKVPSVAGIKKMFDTSWYDANKNTFVLKDKEDLYGLSHLVSAGISFKDKTVRLGTDIVVNTGVATEWAQGKNLPNLKWVPIGNTTAFEGTFDGQGHTISGLYGTTKSNHMGLFGYTGEASIIKNLRVTNSFFEMTESGNRIGSVAGRGEGVFDTIYSDAIINCAGQGIGGIIGYKASEGSASISNCWYAGTINMLSDNSKYSGGIVGRIQNGKLTIDNCLFTGTIRIGGAKRSASVGGLCGYAKHNLVIKNSMCTGSFVLTEASGMNSTRRIIGQIANEKESKVNVENVYYTIDGTTSTASWYCSGDLATIKGGAEAKPREDILGYNGHRTTALDFENYWAVVLAETSGADGTPVLKSFASATPSVAGKDKIFDVSWYKEKKNSYVLYDKEDLYGFAYLCNSGVNFKGKTIKLGKNITVNASGTEYRWTPAGKIAAFEGTFDGNGKTISGLYGTTDSAHMGLFGATGKDSVVKNLSIKDSYFESTATSGARIGSVAGRGEGQFHTIYSDAIITTYGQGNGGIVGYNSLDNETSLTNCWYAGTIYMKEASSKFTGGLLGRTEKGEVQIDNCLFSGTISVGGSTRSSSTGGFVGIVNYEVSVSNSLNSGTFEFEDASKMNSVGRIFGQVANASSSKIELDNVYYTTVGKNAKTKWYCAGDKPTIKGTPQAMAEKEILGYLAYFHTALNFDEYWTFVVDNAKTTLENEAGTPVLKSFASGKTSLPKLVNNADISWYDKEKDIYTLDSTGDFRGFGYLSSIGMDFEGKTVNLTTNVSLNEGSYSDAWDKWTPIGSPTCEFAGEFNGNNHSISGVYVDTNKHGAGLFGGTAEGSVIKNLKLENSYITSTGRYVGSVVGSLSGDMENVYSSATVVTNGAYAGGLVGQIWSKGSVDMSRCWFAGNASFKMSTGGVVGKIAQGNVTMTDCLNSGTIVCASTLNGGICGIILPCDKEWDTGSESGTTKLTMTNILNVGTLTHINNTTTGSVVGKIGIKTEVNFVNVYTTEESYINPTSNESVAIGTQVKSAKVTGADDIKMWSLENELTVSDTVTEKMVQEKLEALNFKTIWCIGTTGTPGLQWATDLHYNTAWYNETDTSYTIRTAKDLYGFSYLANQGVNFAGKTIRLIADITLNDGTVDEWKTNSFANLREWIPVGSQDNEFAGIFDANEHSISGLYVNASEQGAGLFGGTTEDSVIKNLKLENSYIKSTATHVGSIVGSLSGDLENVYSSATVISTANAGVAGGLVGQVWTTESRINKCWYAGNLTTIINSGGIVGVVAKGTVTMEDCLNTGTIDYEATATSNKFIGGLCGRTNSYTDEWSNTAGGGNSIALYMKRCLNTGQVKNIQCLQVGSILGRRQSGQAYVESVYATNESYVYAQNESIALGKYKNANKQIVSSTLTSGTVQMVNLTDIQVSNSVTADSVKNRLSGFDFNNTWGIGASNQPELQWVFALYADTSWYDESENSFTLTTAKQLYGLAYLCKKGTDFAGKTIHLGADITVNNGTVEEWKTNSFANLQKWIPIGTANNEFAGTFDGHEYTISGIYVNANEKGAGLFGGTAEGSVIKNLKLENSYITSTAVCVGSIAGSLSGNMENVYSSATVVTTAGYAGGLVGQIWSQNDVSMTHCWYGGSTNVKLSAGGLVGKIAQGNVTMTDCLNSGTITCTGTLNGGICGIILPADSEWADKPNETGETKVTMTNVLNIGTMSHLNNTTTGSVFGKIGKGTEVIFVNVYTTYESYIYPTNNTPKAIGQQVASCTVTGEVNMKHDYELIVSGTVTEVAVKEALIGFDFANVWKIGAEGKVELQ